MTTEPVLTSVEVNEARRPHTCSRPCAFEEKHKNKKTRNPAAPKTHHEIHSSPATATTSRRRATKHVPRVSPYSPASIDPGFVEIGRVQLSQSVKPTNVTHNAVHRRKTDRQSKIRQPCTHPGMTRLFCLLGENGLIIIPDILAHDVKNQATKVRRDRWFR